MPEDLSSLIAELEGVRITDRVKSLRDAYFDAVPEVCPERPFLLTKFHTGQHLLRADRITGLDKARAYRHVLRERTARIWDFSYRDRDGVKRPVEGRSLLAGSTTSRFKGVILYPELMALALWPELRSLPHRPANPYHIDPETRRTLNEEVFPAWMDASILERARVLPVPEGQAEPRFELLQYLVFYLASKPNCISHTIPDFRRAVSEGLRAVIDDARARRQQAADDEAQDFYQSVVEGLEGIIAYSRKLGDAAARQARGEPDAKLRAELEALAEIHRRVPEHPARSFREGLTTVWICWIACHLENANVGLSLGRLDQLLVDLYRRDREAGRLSVAEAVELTCCLWLKIGDHVPTVPQAGEQLFGGTGSNQAITIGGVDRQGRDAVNELTHVMLRATELMQLRDPNLNARFHPEVNERSYLERLCLANLRTGATPALHNDRAAIAALQAKGDAMEDARDYGVVGCVEPCSNGRHFGHSGALLVNLPSVLELTLFNGCHRHTGLDQRISLESGDPREMTSFEDFRKAFLKQARWMAEQTVAVNNALGRAHQRYQPSPLLSALFEGPLDDGRDVIHGGAKGNSSGVAVIGLADVADSLTAIRKVVFAEDPAERVDFATLLEAVRSDFRGDPDLEALRQRLRNNARTPPFGISDPAADGQARWIAEQLDEIWGTHENYRGGRYRVGYWTMTNHAGFGKLMGALPSGRRAGESFSSGITPESGRTPELLPALEAVRALPARMLSNGVALNLKFTPAESDGLTEAQQVELMASAVLGYMDPGSDATGGLEVQFNVTENHTFEQAQQAPEQYPELLVRVSGYTAYFRDLNEQMQREIIERTEYRLSSGEAVNPTTHAVTASRGAAGSGEPTPTSGKAPSTASGQ
jgi:formate C-acetyltransferase